MILINRTVILLSSILILALINHSCSSNVEEEHVILNKEIESILVDRLGADLRSTLRIHLDSSYIIESNEKIRFSQTKNLDKKKNVPMSIFFYVPSKTTQEKYHILTISFDNKNEINKFEGFLTELESLIEKDTVTFYTPRELAEKFNSEYGHKARFLSPPKNGKEWFLTISSGWKNTIDIQMNRYNKIDTMENGTIWYEGWFIKYNLLEKSYSDGGTISTTRGYK
jgi:hypothetical protein